MPMKLVRRPRAVRRIQPLVLKEVRTVWRALAETSIRVLADDVAGWTTKPLFTYKVSVGPKRWQFRIKWDKKSEGGKRYQWVSEGTGARGLDPAGRAYTIIPRRVEALKFGLPLVTQTTSARGVAPSTFAPPGVIVTGKVTAPGIYPREFGKELYALLKSRHSGSVHNVTEAAIKRGFRKALKRAGLPPLS